MRRYDVHLWPHCSRPGERLTVNFSIKNFWGQPFTQRTYAKWVNAALGGTLEITTKSMILTAPVSLEGPFIDYTYTASGSRHFAPGVRLWLDDHHPDVHEDFRFALGLHHDLVLIFHHL